MDDQKETDFSEISQTAGSSPSKAVRALTKDAIRPEPELSGKGGKKKKTGWDHFILKRKRTTSEFIENVLQNIIESIVVTSLSGRLVFFNKYSEEMFGYTAREVMDRHIALLGVSDPDVIGCIRQNQSFSGEVTLRRRDGSRFPAYVRCVPLGDELGRPMAMVGVATDLTYEKEKECVTREMARLKSFNENIVASINDGIQIIDRRGFITFVNHRMEELLEYREGRLVGSHYSAIVAPEDQFRLAEIIRDESADKSGATFEVSWITGSGKKLRTLVSASYLKHGSDSPGAIVAVTDTSELQDLKEELFQSEKMSLVGTLASEMGHEINNPLGGLTVAVQMLIKDLESGQISRADVLEELRDIETYAKRCRNITRQLLDFSRPIARERVSLDLNGVIEDALVLVQRQAEQEDIRFEKEYSLDLPNVVGDPGGLQQIVINLVKNSQDAMPGGGLITISTWAADDEEGSWVWVGVGDAGPGIPGEIRDNIFHPFLTTKQRGRGTGLGLAVSKRIVEEFGGRIGFENKPGGGVEFRFKLPAEKAPTQLNYPGPGKLRS